MDGEYWIRIDEDDPETFPKNDDYILLSFSNYPVPTVGRCEKSADGGCIFFAGDDDKSLISRDVYVNGWMPLPECLKD